MVATTIPPMYLKSFGLHVGCSTRVRLACPRSGCVPLEYQFLSRMQHASCTPSLASTFTHEPQRGWFTRTWPEDSRDGPKVVLISEKDVVSFLSTSSSPSSWCICTSCAEAYAAIVYRKRQPLSCKRYAVSGSANIYCSQESSAPSADLPHLSPRCANYG